MLDASEEARLAALASYCVLDTDAEDEYDDLTRLAAQICDTPIALVSLVDRDRQWFKSRHGLTVTETPRDQSFCAHAVAKRATLVVADATADPRFHDNPLVTGEPRIRFYAGVPLLTADGPALGSLCVIDRRPRLLEVAQLEALQALSRQVVRLLEMRRVTAKLAEALAGMNTLRRLMPMCAWCRKVRDDAGYWGQVEAYLSRHAGVDTSHGICPACEVAVTRGGG